MSASFRVGVAGLGFGASIHVPGFRQIPGVEVAAICARDLTRATETARVLGIPRAVSSIEELLDLELDAVSLALPPAGNRQGAALAVSRGIPILCEKPLASDPVVAAGLAASAADLTTCIDFQFAELDAFRKVRSLIDTGAFGKLKSVDVRWLTLGQAQRMGIWSWKRDREQDGGVMTLLGAHLLYLLEWMCGPVASLSGQSFARSLAGVPLSARVADDSVELSFDFASGATGRATVSNASTDSLVHAWELVFTNGTITLQNDTTDYMRGFRVVTTNTNGTRVEFEDATTLVGDGRLAPFVRLASRFVSAVRVSEAVKPDFGDGARVAALAALVHTRA